MTDTVAATEVADLLRTAVPSASVLGDSASPGVGRNSWNGMPGFRPKAAIACRAVADVVGALGVARDRGLPVAVMGGGHDPWLRHVRQDGIVLDLARMNGVTVDPPANTVTVGGGATTADLFSALPEDRVVPTGTATYVGLAGLAMGGGYGYLTGRLGLTLDQLERAELVLPDGRVVQTDADSEAELFWALRGGGSGIGVATSLTFRMTTLEQVSAAIIAVELDHAAAALVTMQDLLDAHPDVLNVVQAFTKLPSGEIGLALSVCWAGGEPQGDTVIARLKSLRGASVVSAMKGPYRRALRTDGRRPYGMRYVADSRSIERVTLPIAELLADSARQMPSTGILFLHDFHGAAARVAVDATAFRLRRDHFAIGIISRYSAEEASDEAHHRAWVRTTAERLEPIALPGGYINFLGPEREDRVQQFYGSAAGRLRRIRRSVDPDGMFAGGVGFFS